MLKFQGRISTCVFLPTPTSSPSLTPTVSNAIHHSYLILLSTPSLQTIAQLFLANSTSPMFDLRACRSQAPKQHSVSFQITMSPAGGSRSVASGAVWSFYPRLRLRVGAQPRTSSEAKLSRFLSDQMFDSIFCLVTNGLALMLSNYAVHSNSGFSDEIFSFIYGFTMPKTMIQATPQE